MNKNKYLFILAVFMIALVTMGTYAAWTYASISDENTITSGQVTMSFSEKNEITLNNVLPMKDEDGIRLEEYFDFSVSSYIKTREDDDTSRKLYYNVILEKLNPVENTTSLNDSEVKVYLTKLNSDGSETEVLAPTTIDKLEEYLILSQSEEFKNNKSRVETNYRLRAWLDFEVDASKFNGTTAYSYNFRVNINNQANNNEVVNLDTSKANRPDLLTNMIPVYYDATCNNNQGCWEKADSNNTEETYKWYNYDEKMWANAVTVDEANRDTYISAPEGTEIPMDDINTMWVWVPRYTYTYFNDGTNTPKEIQISFEEGTASNGTITCTDAVNGGTTQTSQTCTDKNTNTLTPGTSTYTHPSFDFGGTQLEGFWFGKFENSINGTNLTSESTAEHEITIKPNLASLKYKAVSYLFTDIRQMEKYNNIYGFEQSSSTTFNLTGELTGDNNNIDTHMLKNIEWGAVAYLSHSKYGINNEVAINSYRTETSTSTYAYKTGCGPQSADSTSSGTTCNAYNTTLGQSASTTGNVYGVYDMSGGAVEYVMGNMVNSSGNFYPSNAGQWSSTTKPLAKYYDSYTYDSSSYTTYTRGRLGDATIEMAPTGISGNWYSDYAKFMYSTGSWFLRGGYCGSGANAGAFYFVNYHGNADSTYGSRSALVVLN